MRGKPGIERILIEALDEGPERQDVGRLPGSKPAFGLPPVEFLQQRSGEATVGRDDRNAGTRPREGAARSQALEQLRARRGLIPVSGQRP